MQWPPEGTEDIRLQQSEWSAWYSGSRRELEDVGGKRGSDAVNGRVGRVYTGVARAWRRFWGATVTDQTTEPKIKIHVPLAADIARASADLLFSEPPAINAISPAGEPHPYLETLLDDKFWGELAGAAETCAALGGVFLRAVAKQGRRPEDRRLFISRVDADCGYPTFEWDALVKVVFSKRLPFYGDRSTYWRHLEKHFLDPVTGDGMIEHQLWAGTANDLGKPATWADHPDTAELLLLNLDENGLINTGPGLDVVYVPNVTPNPLWRKDPVGSHLGAPDIAGSEDLLDRLDHVMSALMREVDLAKARIIVPEYMLDTGRPGQGQTWDADREVWSALNVPINPQQPVMKPELFQPEIRVDQLLKVAQELVENIVRSAGYSAATFGEDEQGAATATEVNAKTARSRLTRSKKIRHWTTGLDELVNKLITMALALGWVADDPMGLAAAEVVIEFPQPQQTPLELAQTALALFQAQSASIETRVRAIHPEWDDTQVEAEVEAIKEELGAGAPVPEDPTANEDPFATPPLVPVAPELPVGADAPDALPVE